jgi:hypothetical protein
MSAQARTVILLFAALWLGQAAWASPDLARAWGEGAGALRNVLAGERAGLGRDAAAEAVPGPETRLQLMRFAGQADQLAHAIDRVAGPADLGCIFRGLSEEVGVQLDVLDDPQATPAQRGEALRRLEKAADDAVAVARAAEIVLIKGAAAGDRSSAAGCAGGGVVRPDF